MIKAALKIAKADLEKRKYAATDRPRRPRGCSSTRGIPAEVKRAVRERDGGQCAYVSETGRRCPARVVEFDHIEPVARGGISTVENVRLLCRAHNQLAAEKAFGVEFMERKRAEAIRTQRS